MKFYAAHKLISDVDNKVTFYLDPDFKTDFMDQLVLDCKALATNEVKTTTSKVTHFLEIVWSTLLHMRGDSVKSIKGREIILFLFYVLNGVFKRYLGKVKSIVAQFLPSRRSKGTPIPRVSKG